MCGIAGRIGARAIAVDIEAVLHGLSHRGPDDQGVLTWSPGSPLTPVPDGQPAAVTLLHTRLAIIDLDRRSRQPMIDRSQDLAIVFNGEIYNYLELRGELEGLGHRFSTQGDTEVILAAWQAWGGECLNRFDGMFAFAILDTKRRFVHLVRDGFGVKPLFYAHCSNGLAFSSEPQILHRLTGESHGINSAGVVDYVAFGLTDHRMETLRQGIYMLPPGTVLTLDMVDFRTDGPTSFWTLDGRGVTGGLWGAAKKVRSLLTDSVRFHLRSDVPLAVSLSGGIDSSAILALARKQLPKDRHLDCFLYGADNHQLDETRFAEIAAARDGITLHRVSMPEDRAWDDLERLIRIQGEPFNSTSVLAQYYLFEAMRERGVKVSLGGQGADEMFAGYPNFVTWIAQRNLEEGNLIAARYYSCLRARLIDRLSWPSAMRQAREHVKAYQPRTSPTYFRSSICRTNALDESVFVEHAPDLTGRPFRATTLHGVIKSSLRQASLPRLLRYEDRNAMHHSIENRVPYCWKPLAELAFSLPPFYLLSFLGETKRVLRKALRGSVPGPILERKDKIGFFSPDERLIRSNLGRAEAIVMDTPAGLIPGLEVREVQQQWKRFATGEIGYNPRLWRWLNLCLWAQQA